MTAPKRVAVERMRELLAKATPGPLETVQNTNVCWEIRYQNWRRNHYVHDGDMAALIVAAVNALPALLQQVAELEQDRDEWKARESFAVSDLQRELRERDAKLAERDAEIEQLRDGFAEASRYAETAATYKLQCEAAERAKEDACGLLREAVGTVRDAATDARINEHPHRGDRLDEMADRIAAFLAANGGGK